MTIRYYSRRRSYLVSFVLVSFSGLSFGKDGIGFLVFEGYCYRYQEIGNKLHILSRSININLYKCQVYGYCISLVTLPPKIH